MRAVIYIRVSSDEQVKGYSLDKQQEECILLIKRSGYTYVDTYMDDGYTAKNMNRPALKQMLDDLQKKKFDMIVVWSTDRLTRDIIDGLNMVKNIFNKQGIKFASVTEDIDTSTYDGMMMLTMRLMMAQRERERIGERVTMGLSKKASIGRRVALGKIYGYNVENGELVVDFDEAHIVKQIFDWYVYKGWGYGKIAKTLNDEGVSAKVSSWQASTIKGMLQNPTYIGMNKWKGETVKGEHEPIVLDEVFSLAQTQLQRRGALEMSRSSYNYPFSSIIKCGACGASYTASYTKKPTDRQGYVNYRCSNRKPGLCKEPDIAGFKFEKMFFEYFNTIEIEADEYVPAPTKEDMKTVEKEKARISKQLAKLEKRKSNLLDDLGDRLITREDYKSKSEELTKSIAALQAELDVLEPAEVAATSSSKEVIDFILNLEQNWNSMPNEDQKFIIQMMFKKIEISKKDDWVITKMEPA